MGAPILPPPPKKKKFHLVTENFRKKNFVRCLGEIITNGENCQIISRQILRKFLTTLTAIFFFAESGVGGEKNDDERALGCLV